MEEIRASQVDINRCKIAFHQQLLGDLICFSDLRFSDLQFATRKHLGQTIQLKQIAGQMRSWLHQNETQHVNETTSYDKISGNIRRPSKTIKQQYSNKAPETR